LYDLTLHISSKRYKHYPKVITIQFN